LIVHRDDDITIDVNEGLRIGEARKALFTTVAASTGLRVLVLFPLFLMCLSISKLSLIQSFVSL
jgi:hypothetical protein